MFPNRVFISGTNGRDQQQQQQPFFSRFRAGFRTILSEVNKLEQICTEPIQKPLPTSYFNDSIVQLEALPELHQETLNLFNTVTNKPINIDPIEDRLLALREKLIKLEENPDLIKKGYKPYIPPGASCNNSFEDGHGGQGHDGDDDSSENVVRELSFSSPATTTMTQSMAQATPKQHMFTPSKFASYTPKPALFPPVETTVPNGSDHTGATNGTNGHVVTSAAVATTRTSIDTPDNKVLHKMDVPKVTNPNLANCLDILKRWNMVDGPQDPPNQMTGNGQTSSSSFTPGVNRTFMVSKLPMSSSSRNVPESHLSASSQATATMMSSSVDAASLGLKPASKFKQPAPIITTTNSSLTTGSSSAHINRSKTFTRIETKTRPGTGGQGGPRPFSLAEDSSSGGSNGSSGATCQLSYGDTVELTPFVSSKVARK